MSKQPFRLSSGGHVDRSQNLSFTFDGKRYQGHPGDTLASALLANGVRLVGRSFKYHRPRGIFSAGAEEPNALVELREGARQEANTRATQIELFDGLVAKSQNRSFSLRFDPSQVNDLMKQFLPAGFYYKTFMGPFSNTKIWMFFEAIIRKAAGMGTASRAPDPDYYDYMSWHCEVLVVGAGPAGLSAARAAAKSGTRVVLIEDRPHLGGQLRRERVMIDGKPASDWVEKVRGELEANPKVKILTRTTAFGYYDHNMVCAAERVSDHLLEPLHHQPRQRLWWIRAARVVLATGAIEQPLVFGDNDRPGVMLAGAVRAYANDYGVLAGKRIVVFTNNDDAYRTAIDLHDAGARIIAIADTRKGGAGALAKDVADRQIPVLLGQGVVRAHGSAQGLRSAEIMPIAGIGSSYYDCDVIAMSGGWMPAIHLFSQSGGKTAWDAEKHVFVPGQSKQAEVSVGAAKGDFALAACLKAGASAGAEAAKLAGYAGGDTTPAKAEEPREHVLEPLWVMPDPPSGHPKKFVDHQDDVATNDVALAEREGYKSVEHLKRYTTLGMGTDQGKTSNLTGLALMAAQRGLEIPQVGHTTFRPPYTPVALGLLGGSEIGQNFVALRRTPMDQWNVDHGAVFIDAGMWRRPRFFPLPGEGIFEAYVRETKITREKVGVCDVTTLGKIDIQGPDAAEFLNRVYTNGWTTLAVGKARYGLMLREDGFVYDDGTTSRLGESHFVMTTTTANAVKVMAELEKYLQIHWPEMKVQVTSVTEQWAAIAVAGPRARDTLAKVVDLDLANEAFPFMGAQVCTAAGIPDCRLFRISFSGELAYEINVPSDYGSFMMDKIMEAAHEFGGAAYGTEALGNMRIEKGHVAGSELDGRTTAEDLGLGKMMSSKKEFVGKTLAYREVLADGANRLKLVGFRPLDGTTKLKQGAQITETESWKAPVKPLGHVTATGWSPEIGGPIALGLLRGGLKAWEGKTVYMANPVKNQTVAMTVCHPIFVDREGSRLHD